MSIEIDPELALRDAGTHEEVGETLHTALNGVPSSVDGGIAANEVAVMIALAVGEAGAVADINTMIGGIMTDIANDAIRTDEGAREAFLPLLEGLMGE
ncbi:hypothetical protein [Litorihabitans aurantiacus]|uniref:Uncharacterized protein n=1 Tax=Litorihabitans aurantiacus TaxID=1930061 RepID=A0AA37XHF0_9MICO|nr:hypothetical protein [Litorihabitans aurantiacus]GMA33315.1 hypothetical protein GCM10025875_33070 [Litorihabitans aurantiacus]